MHPTSSDYRNTSSSPALSSSAMYTPLSSPMFPGAPAPWPGAPQQQNQQNYEDPRAHEYYMQMSTAHWQMQMQMYHQQHFEAQMAGMAGGVGVLVPVAIPHHQSPPMVQVHDPRTGQWLQQSSPEAGKERVAGPQNAQGLAQSPQELAPNAQGLAQNAQDPRTGQVAVQNPQGVVRNLPPGLIQDPKTGQVTVQNPQGVIQNLPPGLIQDPRTGQVVVQNLPPGLVQDPRTGQWGYPAGFPLPTQPGASRKEQKARRPFTDVQLLKMNSRFARDQFIKVHERRVLAKEIGLSADQIKIWFQNKRHKIRKAAEMRQLVEEREQRKAEKTIQEVQELAEQHERMLKEQMDQLELETETEAEEPTEKMEPNDENIENYIQL